MTAEVIGRLPHRAPFLFLSSVDELSVGSRGLGSWVVTGDEAFFGGHFPGDPIVPGVLIIEALAQLAGLVGASEARGGRLAHANVKLHESVRPPARIGLEARVERSLGHVWLFDVEATHGEIVAASGSLALALGGT